MAKVTVPLNEAVRLLHPKPVVLIVSTDASGRSNIMTAAWTMPVSRSPPLIAVAISPRRYTFQLIRQTGEFTVNVVTEELVKAAEYCGSVSGRAVDKAAAAGLTLRPSQFVKPPVIEESVGNLECRVVREVEAGDHWIFVAEVLAARADATLFGGGTWDIESRILLHVGSDTYASLRGPTVGATRKR